jgi:hypothetical protein
MMRKLMALVAAGTMVLVSGPAYGAGPGPAQRTDLTVSYMADAGYAAAVTLSCDPAGGAHPKAAKACAALKKVSGKPGKLKPAQVMCTLEYAPITAQIKGTWKGKPLSWSQKFPNTCDLGRATGVIFAF